MTLISNSFFIKDTEEIGTLGTGELFNIIPGNSYYLLLSNIGESSKPSGQFYLQSMLQVCQTVPLLVVFMETGRKITALKVQKKNPNRVNVYLDGAFAFGLARIVAAWLEIGQILDVEKIETLLSDDTREVAFQKALHFLNYRPRSEEELSKKLGEDGFDQVVIDQVMERLRQNRLVDDGQFARAWVENRLTFRPRSKKILQMELRRKGIDENVIEETLEEIDGEELIARQVGEKYSRRLSGLERNEFRSKLYGYLARKGFDFDTIQPLAEDLWNLQEKTGENLMQKEGEDE